MDNKTIDERVVKDKQSLLDALKEMPIVQVACKRSGIGRATYYRWRNEDRVFKRQSQESLDQGIEYINDMSESQLISLIKEKKMPAIALWLRHNHARYGSTSKSQIPVATIEDLSPEEQKLVQDALGLTAGIKQYEGNTPTLDRKDQVKQENKAESSL